MGTNFSLVVDMVQGKPKRPLAGYREFWVNPKAAGYRPLAGEQRFGYHRYSDDTTYWRRGVLLLVLAAVVLLTLISIVLVDQDSVEDYTILADLDGGLPEPQALHGTGEMYLSKIKIKHGSGDKTYQHSISENQTIQQEHHKNNEIELSEKLIKKNATGILKFLQAIKKQRSKNVFKKQSSGDSTNNSQLYFGQTKPHEARSQED